MARTKLQNSWRGAREAAARQERSTDPAEPKLSESVSPKPRRSRRRPTASATGAGSAKATGAGVPTSGATGSSASSSLKSPSTSSAGGSDAGDDLFADLESSANAKENAKRAHYKYRYHTEYSKSRLTGKRHTKMRVIKTNSETGLTSENAPRVWESGGYTPAGAAIGVGKAAKHALTSAPHVPPAMAAVMMLAGILLIRLGWGMLGFPGLYGKKIGQLIGIQPPSQYETTPATATPGSTSKFIPTPTTVTPIGTITS